VTRELALDDIAHGITNLGVGQPFVRWIAPFRVPQTDMDECEDPTLQSLAPHGDT
jgi:hypothetical protein